MITSNRNTRKRVVARDHQHEAPFVDAIPTTRYLGVRLANNALVVDCKEHIAMLKLSLPVGRNKRRKGVVASDERAVQRRRAIDPPAASNLHHSRPGSHSRQVNSDKGVVLNAACGGWTDRHRERVCVCVVCARGCLKASVGRRHNVPLMENPSFPFSRRTTTSRVTNSYDTIRKRERE